MRIETSDEENPFNLEDLVVKPSATSTNASAPLTTARKRGEMFARITERHLVLLSGVARVSTVILFNHLMIQSVKASHRPFVLPVDYLTKKTGINYRNQMRALRTLAKVGLVAIERSGLRKPPHIIIPGTTKQPH